MNEQNDPRIEGLNRIRAQFAAIDEMMRDPDARTIRRTVAAEALTLGFPAVIRFDDDDRVVSVESLGEIVSFTHCESVPAPSIVRQNGDGSWTAEPMPRPF